jgi:integrative and conjugative element protein (TIGR02256 family)
LNLEVADRSFQSGDERFGLKIRGEELRKVLKYCIEAEPLETGGILVGSYSEDHAVAFVSDVSKAPRDSRGGETWFYRGIQGLQSWLFRLWNTDRYYLGEWHFHPGAKPIPSDRDLRQIKEIAESPTYCCPEPVLLIIGGWADSAWEVGVYVSPRGRALTELIELVDGSVGRGGDRG